MEAAAKKTILRIELWQGLILFALLVTLRQTGWVDPKALLLGGVFMGINFFFAELRRCLGTHATGGQRSNTRWCGIVGSKDHSFSGSFNDAFLPI